MGRTDGWTKGAGWDIYLVDFVALPACLLGFVCLFGCLPAHLPAPVLSSGWRSRGASFMHWHGRLERTWALVIHVRMCVCRSNRDRKVLMIHSFIHSMPARHAYPLVNTVVFISSPPPHLPCTPSPARSAPPPPLCSPRPSQSRCRGPATSASTAGTRRPGWPLR